MLPAYWVSLVVLRRRSRDAVLHNPRRASSRVRDAERVRALRLPQRVNVVYVEPDDVEWHFYLLVPLVALLMTRIGSLAGARRRASS